MKSSEGELSRKRRGERWCWKDVSEMSWSWWGTSWAPWKLTSVSDHNSLQPAEVWSFCRGRMDGSCHPVLSRSGFETDWSVKQFGEGLLGQKLHNGRWQQWEVWMISWTILLLKQSSWVSVQPLIENQLIPPEGNKEAERQGQSLARCNLPGLR